MRFTCVLFAALLMLPLSAAQAACTADTALNDYVREHYGERIEFDVYRKGKRIGHHVTHFDVADGELHVRSRMSLTIKVLGVPFYRYAYASTSTWCGDTLQSLRATVNDNGNESSMRAKVTEAGLTIESAGGNQQAPAALLPTDHWNPRVLGAEQVINTITGRINQVVLARCAGEKSGAQHTALPADARCYEYTGDLSARVWYDAEQRWVGLMFKGSDGSEIVYRCRHCARPT